ncbi:MAG: hypothetical protein IPO13_08660 [Rhodocyclaceae bacterium]|nr:hypothetical protein [Rhodocyclaceae bacterium]
MGGRKIEVGAQYVVGQHGNNYGTHRYMFPAIEEDTADKFLTWGWTDGLPQHAPAFILKTAGSITGTFDPNGGLALIELHMPHRLATWDEVFEFNDYFADQQLFIEKLECLPRDALTLRLHGAYTRFRWAEKARWRDFDTTLKIDTGALPIETLIARSRLIVHSYDSTGILETLSRNIPTLAFWQNGLDHVRDSARPYYQLLVDAGIVHLTAQSAAAKVNEIWMDVVGWWSSASVQRARMQFCDRYARGSVAPSSDLKRALFS